MIQILQFFHSPESFVFLSIQRLLKMILSFIPLFQQSLQEIYLYVFGEQSDCYLENLCEILRISPITEEMNNISGNFISKPTDQSLSWNADLLLILFVLQFNQYYTLYWIVIGLWSYFFNTWSYSLSMHCSKERDLGISGQLLQEFVLRWISTHFLLRCRGDLLQSFSGNIGSIIPQKFY